MENAWILLGIRDSASSEEIEEAWRNKKLLCNPDRFVKGTSEWELAYARSEALDKAYAEAMASVFVPRRSDVAFGRSIRAFSSGEPRRNIAAVPSFGRLLFLLPISPVVACLMQFAVPAILFDLTPGGLRGGSLLTVAFVVLLSYTLPLLLRFVLLRRPVEGFLSTLVLFPATLLTTDLLASALLYFSFMLPGHEFRYVPVFYVTGWGPLFLIFCAHCAILRVSEGRWAFVPSLRRLTSYTLVLFLSVALSMAVCAVGNREKGTAVAAARAPVEVASPAGAPGGPWLSLELFDAGILEIPGSWYVEDSNGRDRRIDHGQIVQHVREALVARPYGQKEEGPDFAFEVTVYRWTRRNGQALPSPGAALDRVQDQQFESLKESYPDVVSQERTQEEQEGRIVSSMTVETRSIPGYVVRFRNLAFEGDNNLYCITVGYPAQDEPVWESVLKEILRRWRL